jgi:multidrug efflux pump subunit AcrA (membrane-fusion protein)
MTDEEKAAADAAAAEQAAAEQAAQEQAAQEAEAKKQQTQQQQQQRQVPAGYVPVGEVVKERNKTKDIGAKLTLAEQKVQEFEHKEAKRGLLKEALGTLGDNFHIPKSEDLDTVIEAIRYDAEKPDNTKAVITKLVEAAKRPVQKGGSTPMFGTATGAEQNKPADGNKAGDKHELWNRMQARRKAAGKA